MTNEQIEKKLQELNGHINTALKATYNLGVVNTQPKGHGLLTNDGTIGPPEVAAKQKVAIETYIVCLQELSKGLQNDEL